VLGQLGRKEGRKINVKVPDTQSAAITFLAVIALHGGPLVPPVTVYILPDQTPQLNRPENMGHT
jgi:hypothetical protein